MSLSRLPAKNVRTWLHEAPRYRQGPGFWRTFAQELGWPFWLGVAGVVALIWELVR